MCNVIFSVLHNEHANILASTEMLLISLTILVRGVNFKIFESATGTCEMCRLGPLHSLTYRIAIAH